MVKLINLAAAQPGKHFNLAKNLNGAAPIQTAGVADGRSCQGFDPGKLSIKVLAEHFISDVPIHNQ